VTPTSRRHLTTGVTLAVLVVVLCVMAIWGYQAATAPVESTSTPSSTATPTCDPQQQKVSRYLHRKDVTVSVYNSGKKSGRARETMDLLERAGFRPGEVSNAPEGVSTDRAVVYSTKSDDPAAELVALALGKNTQVVHTDETLGPGVEVVIGDKFKKLDPKAPNRIELPKPEVTCD
jgi:hypothetical protein